jgi:hypothetical protein
MAAALSDAKSLLEAAAVEEEQLDLLAPPSPEEMAEAREDLGPRSGQARGAAPCSGEAARSAQRLAQQAHRRFRAVSPELRPASGDHNDADPVDARPKR